MVAGRRFTARIGGETSKNHIEKVKYQMREFLQVDETSAIIFNVLFSACLRIDVGRMAQRVQGHGAKGVLAFQGMNLTYR
jgi:hypothetical protein